MKLLALVTDAFGGRGGIAKFNRDLLTAVACHPTCDELIALPRVIAHEVRNVPRHVDFRTRAAGGVATYALELSRVLAAGKVDGVICGHLHLMPAAALAARVHRVPLLLIAHGVEAWEPPRHQWMMSGLRRVDALVCVSKVTEGRFLSWSRIRPRYVFVVPNCVDSSLFGVGAKSEQLLARYRLRGRTVILTVGRMAASERYKGIDELIELLPTLSTDLPNVSYLIIGDGDDRVRLEEKVWGLGLTDRVVFAGYVPESEKAEHYRLADTFVMIGRGEGFGIVYLEAMACGVPVVASSADASREAVLDGRLGELASPDDPASIRAAVLRALRRPRRVPIELQHFSFDAFRDRWHRVLETCFMGSKSARANSHPLAVMAAKHARTVGPAEEQVPTWAEVEES